MVETDVLDNGKNQQRQRNRVSARSTVENLVDDPARGCRSGLVIQNGGGCLAIDYRQCR